MSEPPESAEGEAFRDEDWYADDLGAARFIDCTFTDVDFSEVTTRGAMFERCTFAGCRFDASVHSATAFVACELRRCNFFDVTLEGCKLSGSTFRRMHAAPGEDPGRALGRRDDARRRLEPDRPDRA